MKKNRVIGIGVLVIALVILWLFDWYKYGTFMHSWWMQNMMGHMSIWDRGMMQHAGISSEEEFIKHMIPHHQEAVDTSSRLNTITQDPKIKKLTADIVSAQQKEITMMQGRLKEWYSTGIVQVVYQPMMRDTSTLSSITTIEEIWLEDMIQHHMGAVMMAKEVLRLNPRPEVTSFAQEVINVQMQEIMFMRKLLKNH